MRHQMITPIDMPEHRWPTVAECRKLNEWCDRREREMRGHWATVEQMIRASVANSVAHRNARRPKLSAAPTPQPT
jgi:hypothetical protein